MILEENTGVEHSNGTSFVLQMLTALLVEIDLKISWRSTEGKIESAGGLKHHIRG